VVHSGMQVRDGTFDHRNRICMCKA
jgi:hypothetical protein